MKYAYLFLLSLTAPLLQAQEAPAAPPAEAAPAVAAANADDLNTCWQMYAQHAQQGQEKEAKEWYEKYLQLKEEKAKAGDVKHMRELGLILLHGDVYLPPAPEKAVVWLSKAAEAGDAISAFKLGAYFKPFSPEESKRFYAKACEICKHTAETTTDATEKAQALEMLGYMEQEGLGVDADPAAGIAHLEQAATFWAYERLFQTYAKGIGVAVDLPKALSYARNIADTAADADNMANASPNAGQMAWLLADSYLNGKNGVTKDIATGEHYLNIADRLNIRNAIYCKGLRLKNEGKNAEAYICFNRAASMKMPEAMTQAGIMKLHGADGVEQDVAMGLALLHSVASHFSEGREWYVGRAPYELALYYDGIGNEELAEEWYRIASDRNVVEAMARRGLSHIMPGSDAEWSPTLMYKWWKIGSDAGDATCSRYLNIFLWGAIPLILIIVFGLPILVVHLLNKKAQREEAAKEEQKD